jgi:hypothetical protein
MHIAVLIDYSIEILNSAAGSIHPPPAPFWDGEVSFSRTHAIGERVGKAGPDFSVRR